MTQKRKDALALAAFTIFGVIVITTSVKPNTGGSAVLPRKWGDNFNQMPMSPRFLKALYVKEAR